MATQTHIVDAQPVWEGLFSHWHLWREELSKVIAAYGASMFQETFLPKGTGSSKAWTTSLVYGEPRVYGKLPHPSGSCQDKILAMLPCDVQNQIFASVIAISN